MMIAIRSWINNTLMIICPVWRWCNAVVGNSFTPMMVLENIMMEPISTASASG